MDRSTQKPYYPDKTFRLPSPTNVTLPRSYLSRHSHLNKENEKPVGNFSSDTVGETYDNSTTSIVPAKHLGAFSKFDSALSQTTRHGYTSTSLLDKMYEENVEKLQLQRQALDKKLEDKASLETLTNALTDQLESEWGVKVQNMKASVMEKKKELQNAERNGLEISDSLGEKIKLLQVTYKLEQDQLKADHRASKNDTSQKYDERKTALVQEYENSQKLLEEELDWYLKNNKGLEVQLLSNVEFLEKEGEIKSKYSLLLQQMEDDHKLRVDELNLQNEEIQQEINHQLSLFEETLVPEEKELDLSISTLEKEVALLQQEVKSKTNSNSELLEKYNFTEAECRLLDKKADTIQRLLDTTSSEIANTQNFLKDEETKRRFLHNELQDLRGNIRVFCRIRPVSNASFQYSISSSETNIGQECFEVQGSTQTTLDYGSNGELNVIKKEDQRFWFDKIFDETSENSDVFEEVSQMVQSSLDGFSVCIFAYGQTGSGKTYTMLNPGDGIIPMTMKHIYKWIDKLKEYGWQYTLSVQFVEIYKETIVDLLNTQKKSPFDQSKKIEIRHQNKKTILTNVESIEITNQGQLESLLQKAIHARSTASTNANNRSSRSHSIFTITLNGKNLETNELREGVLNLIDLAGSERLSSSMATGDRLKETQHINKSLSCLGDVIHSLKSVRGKDSHIPFRNSKLTYLLQQYLTGDGKTLMFVNISGDSYNETLNSLRFASKVNSTKMRR